MPWMLWESLFSIFLLSRTGPWVHHILPHAQALHMPSWPLIISSDLAFSAEPHGHHLCSMCSLLCSQGIPQQPALDYFSDCILPICLLPTLDYEWPEGPDLPLFILGYSVQPSTCHKRDAHHPDEWILKYLLVLRGESTTPSAIKLVHI